MFASIFVLVAIAFATARETASADQDRIRGLDAELLKHIDLASRLPLSEYGTMTRVALSPSRDGTILLPRESPAMRALWAALVRNGWAKREGPAIVGGFRAAAGYLVTEKGFRGLPLIMAAVKRRWVGVQTELDDYIVERTTAFPSAPARS